MSEKQALSDRTPARLAGVLTVCSAFALSTFLQVLGLDNEEVSYFEIPAPVYLFFIGLRFALLATIAADSPLSIGSKSLLKASLILLGFCSAMATTHSLNVICPEISHLFHFSIGIITEIAMVLGILVFSGKEGGTK